MGGFKFGGVKSERMELGLNQEASYEREIPEGKFRGGIKGAFGKR